MAKGIKTGGRKAGSVNHYPKTYRETLCALFEREMQSGKIHHELNSLHGKDYLDFILKLTAYLLPKPGFMDEPEIKFDFSYPPISKESHLQLKAEKAENTAERNLMDWQEG